MLDAIVRGFKKLWDVSDDVSPRRYRSLGRLLSFLMIIVSVAPLLVLSWINYNQYQASISRETEVPLRDVVQRTSSALEVLLGERLSTVSLISQAYTYGQLSNEALSTRTASRHATWAPISCRTLTIQPSPGGKTFRCTARWFPTLFPARAACPISCSLSAISARAAAAGF